MAPDYASSHGGHSPLGLGAALDVLLDDMDFSSSNALPPQQPPHFSAFRGHPPAAAQATKSSPAPARAAFSTVAAAAHQAPAVPTRTGRQAGTATGDDRVERKRRSEKARRAEMNAALDSLSKVLDEVEIPVQAAAAAAAQGGPKRKKCGEDGACCDGSTATCERESGAREGHRVVLLARAVRQLKALRHAYDVRTTEVMQLTMQAAHAAAPPAAAPVATCAEGMATSEGAAAGAAAAGERAHEQPGHSHPPPPPPPHQHRHGDWGAAAAPGGGLVGGGSAGFAPGIPEAFTLGGGARPSAPAAGAATVRGADAGVNATPGECQGCHDPVARGCVPMMMVMPVWLPAGSRAVSPQVVPVTAELMGLFAQQQPSQAHGASRAALGAPPGAAPHHHHYYHPLAAAAGAAPPPPPPHVHAHHDHGGGGAGGGEGGTAGGAACPSGKDSSTCDCAPCSTGDAANTTEV